MVAIRERLGRMAVSNASGILFDPHQPILTDHLSPRQFILPFFFTCRLEFSLPLFISFIS